MILHLHLGLISDTFSSGFQTKILNDCYASQMSATRPVQVTPLHCTTQIISGVWVRRKKHNFTT
jgi:hypothetical protein